MHHLDASHVLPFLHIREHVFDLTLVLIGAAIVLGKIAYDALRTRA